MVTGLISAKDVCTLLLFVEVLPFAGHHAN